MAKKKLLNEAQVRRFMGLAGLGTLRENIYEEEEPAMDAEEAPAEEPDMEMDDEGEEAKEGDTKEISQDMVDDAAEALASLQGLVDALGGEAGEEGDMDMGDEPEMDMGGDDLDMGGDEEDLDMGGEDEEAEEEDAEEVIAEALKGVNLRLSKNEVVQEVARRVAKRILKAKQAQSRLDEALGNKPTRSIRRSRRTRK